VGFNMSWIFVDAIELDELYAALDVKSTGEAADPYDLGTSRVPLAGLKPKAGWCAVFGLWLPLCGSASENVHANGHSRLKWPCPQSREERN
jgi:hypothetical protein